MNIICIIPSRLQSTRLPRKPLLPIQGKPMIQWVYENALRCSAFSAVIVATDDGEIASVIRRLGGQVVITEGNFLTGTDRVAHVAKQCKADVVVNLQGDEPFVKPKMLEQLISPYSSGELPEMTTLAYPLDKSKKYHDPGAVKVIVDQNDNALYFSRAPIPYFRADVTDVPVYHHIGLYAFRYDFLMHYNTLSQTPLEKAELLEQLRVLEHGYRIRVCLTQEKTLEINTPEEYAAAQAFVFDQE